MTEVSQASLPASLTHRFVVFLLLIGVCAMAVIIRLHAVINYGRVIHEFDPWFNYRATEYMVANGLTKFLTWYDESVRSFKKQ